MKDFISVVGLEDLLAKAGWSDSKSNFEDFYDSLSRSGEHAEVLNELEQRVYKYFAALALPDNPTPYDYLLLGLLALIHGELANLRGSDPSRQ